MLWRRSPKTNKYQAASEKEKSAKPRPCAPKTLWTSRRRQEATDSLILGRRHEVADISTHWEFPRNKRLPHWEPILFAGQRLPSQRRSPSPPRPPSTPHAESFSARRAAERKQLSEQPKESRENTPSPSRTTRLRPSSKPAAPKQPAAADGTTRTAAKTISNMQSKSVAQRAHRNDMVVPRSPSAGRQEINEVTKGWISAGDVSFLSASWLLSRPGQWKVMRFQDLPAEAFVEPGYAAWLFDHLGGLVILSYPWLTKIHPDPHGFHFRSVQTYLKKHTNHFLKLVKPDQDCFRDVGIFWDYASLPQANMKSGERSGQEQHMFARGLKTIEFLYSGDMTIVVQLKHMPPEPFENMNRTPYDNRGWCYFEEVLGVTLKSGFQLLNLALAQDRLDDSSDWQLVASAAQSDNRPPIHPEHLRQELVYKAFSVAADLDMLMIKYADYFFSTVPSTYEIGLAQQYHILGTRSWGAKEVDSLVRSLPAFTSIMKLNLRGRSLGDAGAEKLAKALPSVPHLDTLWLHNCDISNKGISALSHTLKEVKDLRDLGLHGCRFRESGLRDLCDFAFFPWVDAQDGSERAEILRQVGPRPSFTWLEDDTSTDTSKEKEKDNKDKPVAERSWLKLAKLDDLTLPLELAKTVTAYTIDRLVKTRTVQRSRLIVKWLPGQVKTFSQDQHVA